MTSINLVAAIEAILPQTQCTRCGFPSCGDYAAAVAAGQAEINQCPPGGDEGIAALAQLLAKPILPLNPVNGVIKPRQLAVIEEAACIGCTLCIKACPVDAIIGANKMLHTVITEACSGCDLCLPVCPVDCITLVDDPLPWDVKRREQAKERYLARKQRQDNERKAREARLAQQAELLKRVKGDMPVAPDANSVTITPASNDKNDLIAKIMAKAKQKLEN